jgi:Cys-rich protein (TIGR01571 family)
MPAWKNGLFGCFSHKECGAKCCIQSYFCGGCTFASAMEHAGIDLGCFPKDKLCLVWTAGLLCEILPCQGVVLLTMGRDAVAKKYNIDGESMVKGFIITALCTCCSVFQVQNEVMEQEGLSFGCAKLEKGGGAPAQVEMQ